LYWAAMALAIITFGPGAISLDRLIGLDGWSARRSPDRRSLAEILARFLGGDSAGRAPGRSCDPQDSR
jgi:hypothetical protein